MYRVGVCGHFGEGTTLLNGQTIKTKTLTDELKRKLGADHVYTIDTCNWRRNPLKLLIKCLSLIRNCENIIILPAHSGVKVFLPLFAIMNKVFHRKLHYIVIGGWIPELIQQSPRLKKYLEKFDGVYVETIVMVKALKAEGLKNVRYLPNFKRLDVLDSNKLVCQTKQPYKLCTFSRVMQEKGIEDAIKTVQKINGIVGDVVFTLDIYGQIEEKYRERFEKLQKNFPSYVSYKGSIDYDKTVNVLKDYFILLFPTKFKTEGLPGTIIDAYAAGLPVIASNWDSAQEIIDQNKTGFIYDFKDPIGLEENLMKVMYDTNLVIDMKKNCLASAEKYLPEVVIGDFIKYL